uniref:Uncharacterized protein n=1 Tax=Oryza nivara TaxID=4536 RepID=A0A0E0INV0_ORYNI
MVPAPVDVKKKPSARLRMQRWEVEVGGRARWQMKAASEETRPDEVGDVRDEERHDEEEDLVVERTAIVLVCPGIAPLPLQLFTCIGVADIKNHPGIQMLDLSFEKEDCVFEP